MKFSTFAFLSDAFSTSSNILDTVLCPNVDVVLILITPVRFSVPEMTLSLNALSTGADSPVRAAWLTELSPSMMTPSKGIFSPGLTMIISPTSTSSGDTSISAPLRITVALSGLISISFAMDFLDLPTAMLWKSSPI